MPSVVLPLTGGIASRVALYRALLAQGQRVIAFTVDWGQRARQDLIHASEVMIDPRLPPWVEHRWLQLPNAELQFSEGQSWRTRWLVVLALAISQADAVGAQRVIWPVPTISILRRRCMAGLLGLATQDAIALDTPFAAWTLGQVILEAARIDCDLATTWSCHRNGRHHCGKCPGCTRRRRAFAEAGVRDPAPAGILPFTQPEGAA